MGTCPSFVIEICPSHVHMVRLSLVSAGKPWTKTGGWPGIHGETIAGVHGAGVGTPIAAAVSAMTNGLVGAVHMPNEGILVKGAKSMIFAFGLPLNKTVRDGSTTSGQGTSPNEQANMAPAVTKVPIPEICYYLYSYVSTLDNTRRGKRMISVQFACHAMMS